ncbi:MAG TPA: ABC transporter permease subunit [Albidovulum sp.]|uniref:ABC transporter permease n=1 Tax=Albidovulum sp. TaxID=1872424 RepID=UPI002C51A388|nr:ABC transporter permease subunit [Albidovulum sp.]
MAETYTGLRWRLIDGLIAAGRVLRPGRIAKAQPYLLLLPAVLLVSFLAVGLLWLGWLSIHAYDTFLMQAGKISAEQYALLFEPPSGPFYQQTLLRTLALSLTVTAGAVLLGLPVAYVIIRTPSRALRVALLVLLLVPFLMGEIVRTFAWYLILANRGAVGWVASLFGIEDGGLLGTPIGVFVGMMQVSTPLATLLIMPAMRRIDPNLERAAATLGASPARIWANVIVPLSWPGIVAAIIVVLLLNIAEYDMPAILGLGRLPFVANVIGDIYRLQQNLYLGSAFSLLLLVVSTLLVVVPGLLFLGWLRFRRARRAAA